MWLKKMSCIKKLNIINMKKTLLTMAMMLGLLIVTQAQDVKPFSKETLDEIKATPEQRKQVAEIVKEFRQKMDELRSNTSLNDEERKAEWKKLSKHRQDRYWNEILTPEQAKYLKEKEQKMKAEAKP